MSFDFTTLPTKSEFQTANPTPNHTPLTDEQKYNKRKSQVQKRVIRFFSRTQSGGNQELKVRIGFLTNDDKTALQNAVETKGYSCVLNGNMMTIN